MTKEGACAPSFFKEENTMDEYIEYNNEEDNETVTFETKESIFKKPVCDCPTCKEAGRTGQIYEGEKSFYCENARDSKDCDFVLYKNNIEKLIRRDITRDEVKDLCENGSFNATCTKINDATKTYEGIFTLRRSGKYMGLKLNFPQ